MSVSWGKLCWVCRFEESLDDGVASWPVPSGLLSVAQDKLKLAFRVHRNVYYRPVTCLDCIKEGVVSVLYSHLTSCV